MPTIPESYRDLLDKPVVVGLATIMSDGQPQVTPVWIDYDGTYLRVNTALGRAKSDAMIARPQVTVLSIDPANPYRYLEVRGVVSHHTTEGAAAHIDALAKKYLGVDVYPGHTPNETRVTFFIEPTKVHAQG